MLDPLDRRANLALKARKAQLDHKERRGLKAHQGSDPNFIGRPQPRMWVTRRPFVRL